MRRMSTRGLVSRIPKQYWVFLKHEWPTRPFLSLLPAHFQSLNEVCVRSLRRPARALDLARFACLVAQPLSLQRYRPPSPGTQGKLSFPLKLVDHTGERVAVGDEIASVRECNLVLSVKHRLSAS
jgi:hypothetical protein